MALQPFEVQIEWTTLLPTMHFQGEGAQNRGAEKNIFFLEKKKNPQENEIRGIYFQ